MKKTNYMMTAHDVMEELGVSRAKAYGIVREMNAELCSQGYTVIAGKVPRPFWEKKFFGFSSEKEYA